MAPDELHRLTGVDRREMVRRLRQDDARLRRSVDQHLENMRELARKMRERDARRRRWPF